MLENLFIPDDPTSISSSEIELSEDLNTWPLEIQSAIMSAVPMFADVQGQLYMDALDRDKMYAKGSYVVQTPDDDIIVPIIVKSKKLAPVDLFIYKGKWYPMDMENLSAIISSAQLGTDLVANEDIPPTATNRMPTNIMPPGSHGTGTGMISSVANKMSSLNKETTERLLLTLKNNPGVVKKLASNKVAGRTFIKTLETPYVEKHAEVNPFKGTDSVIVSLGGGKFSVKYAKHNSLDTDEAIVDGNCLAQNLKEAGLDCGRIVKDLMTNKVAMSWDDLEEGCENGIFQGYDQIKTAGLYRVISKGNVKSAGNNGYALANVKTASGAKLLVILNNDCYALQEKVAGRSMDSSYVKDFMGKFVKLAGQISVGDTVAVPVPDNADDAAPVSVLPIMKVASISHQKTATVITGRTDMGETAYILTGEKFDVPVRAGTIPGDIMVSKSASAWYIPNDYIVYSLPGTKVELASDTADFRSSYNLNKIASGKSPNLLTANVWKTSANTYAVKMAGAAPTLRSEADVMLLLKRSQGSKVMDSLVKLASGMIKTIDLLAPMKDNDTSKDPKEKKASIKTPKMLSTLKIAAIMDDEEDINTVLSLNYLTPENLGEFKAAVPDMRKAEETLSKLLMSARLGNNIVNEEEVRDTLTSLHSIIKELDSTL